MCADHLARRRNDFTALMLMADVCGDTGHRVEELEWIGRAVQAEPKNARARAHLGHKLLAAGRLQKALVQLERARKLDPDLPAAIAGLAGVHEARNQYDKARKVLDPVLRRGTPGPDIGLVATRVAVHDGRLDDAINLAEAVLGGGPAESTIVRALGFELAKALEKADRHDEAFAAAERANAMMRVPYDAAAARAATDELIATFSPEAVAAMAHSREAGEQAIFLVGMPRCGSTLAERVIHAHPRAFGAGEVDTMLVTLNELSARPHISAPFPACAREWTEDDLTDGATQYLKQLRKLAPKADRIANKHLGNVQFLGAISRVLPAARIVWCRRNRLDHGLSIFMERLTPQQAPWSTRLEDIAAHFDDVERLMRHWIDALGVPILEFDYESLVEDQEGASRRLIEFVGLDWDDACLRYHEVERADATLSFDQVRRPIYRSAMGRAEKYGARLDVLRG